MRVIKSVHVANKIEPSQAMHDTRLSYSMEAGRQDVRPGRGPGRTRPDHLTQSKTRREINDVITMP